ncbi:MAG: hypothetical protein ICV60_03935 [Pyrinomonadaceae bacterium]|nr:hypothetical protein [Pyrinomonadaceae bacterium]
MSEELESTVAAEASEATHGVCRLLRTKTAFGTYMGNMWAWQSGNSTTAVYWCLRTMETAGPDDGYAHPHTCCQGRDCYEGEIE